MKCFWPSTQSGPRLGKMGALAAGLSLVIFFLSGGSAWCGVAPSAPSRVAPPRIPLSTREKTLQVAPEHISEFAPVSQPLALPQCGDVRPPEALLTPDPLLDVQVNDLAVRISFIVGTDGHVHSAFILDSSGPSEDQIVLNAVRFWRYRPALCNGVPTDSEALVRFSIH